ncbi:VanZ family protein [Ignatzschineria larvae DSM 13226]|uniref:VanZ family protein n=1 Tax=Ignatzschineria larvae DSM 13226 TaxID=1111732 RepID=A0ABZ3BXG4_9GAMM|nr:VanZ family protein [Ignatzschineria larvae]
MTIATRWLWVTIFWFVLMTLMLFLPDATENLPTPLLFPQSDKVVHFAIFAILAGLQYHTLNQYRQKLQTRQLIVIFLAFFNILFAASSEIIQEHWVDGRSGDVWDVVADVIGLIAGMGIAKLIALSSRRGTME